MSSKVVLAGMEFTVWSTRRASLCDSDSGDEHANGRESAKQKDGSKTRPVTPASTITSCEKASPHVQRMPCSRPSAVGCARDWDPRNQEASAVVHNTGRKIVKTGQDAGARRYGWNR